MVDGVGQAIVELWGSGVMIQFAVSSGRAITADAYQHIGRPPRTVFLCRHGGGCRFIDVQPEWPILPTESPFRGVLNK